METAKPIRQRVVLLDELRGLCILGVVVFHGLYDLVSIFNISIPLFDTFFIQQIIQPLGAGGFIFISGVVSRYSLNNIKRGLQTLALSAIVTIVTMLVVPDFAVRFGVLTLLGSGMLLYGLIEKYKPSALFFKENSNAYWVLGTILFFLFAFTYKITSRQLGFFHYKAFSVPASFYQSSFMYPFGFPSSSFYSTDYFPLMPWLFLFFSGAYFGIYFLEGKMPKWFYKSRVPFLSKAGQYSLIIYLLHQPVIYGALTLIFKIRNG